MTRTASLVRRAGLAPALVVLALAGCKAPCPPPCPLVPSAIHAEVARERTLASRGEHIDLTEATARMRRGNPDLKRARAAWRTEAAIASVPTPRPNPTFEAGPMILGGADILSGTVVGAIAALGWTVQLTPKRSLQDCLNAIRAEAAMVEVVATERHAYLVLRHDHAMAILSEDLLTAQHELSAAADKAEEAMTQAVAAGDATTLDARIVALETARTKTDALEVVYMVEAARASWRALLGAEVDAPLRPAPTDLPPWPNAISDIETLQSLSLRDHPDLARLRAEHKVAEKVLRLEAARAIPDLDIGGVYEYEVVGSKLALPLGIEIPISDRNQPAIAAALGARAAVKERYAARLTELLADVERNHKLLETKLEKYRLLQLQLVDAREMRKAADETLHLSGALDMTRYLEILRTLRRVKLQELEGRTDVYEGWFKLEQATGAPLLRFANEPGKVQ